MAIESIHWHTLHPRYLNADSRVLDLGANYGMFARSIVERFGCTCVAVEPSPGPFASIPTTGIRKHRLAITPAAGEFTFHVSGHTTASSLYHEDQFHQESIVVQGETLEAFARSLGWGDGIDLLKCDIEGAEIDVLQGTTDAFLRGVKQMTIEFHDFCGITPKPVVEQTLRRLERLGFAHVRMSRVGHQDTWLINRRLCRISTAELLYIGMVVRNWRGLKRVVRRAFGAAS